MRELLREAAIICAGVLFVIVAQMSREDPGIGGEFIVLGAMIALAFWPEKEEEE